MAKKKWADLDKEERNRVKNAHKGWAKAGHRSAAAARTFRATVLGLDLPALTEKAVLDAYAAQEVDAAPPEIADILTDAAIGVEA